MSGGNIDGASACTRSPPAWPRRSPWAPPRPATRGRASRPRAAASTSSRRGAAITTAGNGYSTHVVTSSGVSFAVPHVSGAAALYLQSNPTATPAQVQSEIIANATSAR
ncbi:MAG TPA: S8 family serine peptidase [Longimicrobium sp.]|nr:S8 family serine peptidase [Longimicrobium sp.]